MGSIVDFGVVLQTDPPADGVVRTLKAAENQGFRYGWTFDSHVLWQEPFVIYAQALAATSELIVGPMVTNPCTRDPTVTASLFATLDSMFPDRTICGLGRGDSACRVIGRKPASLEEVRSATHVVRELAEGREIGSEGHQVSLPWARQGWRLPIWLAGYGPKALRMIGEVADGFILQTADPAIAQWTIASVRAAASDHGRNPDEITICVAAPAYVGDDLAHQRDQLRWFGGMVGNHVAELVTRYGREGPVPRALTDYIAGRDGYDYAHHGRADNPTTDFVPDDIVDRFCLLGSVGAHLQRLHELAALGVHQFALYLMHDSAEHTLQAYGDRIIPELSTV